MKSTRKSILDQMAAIERMERGTLCPMRGGLYYNLQSWEGGRNVVRYIPAYQVETVAKAVEGYRQFMELAMRYSDLVIKDTRKAALKSKNRAKTPPSNKN